MAPILASLSAVSFPLMLQCPGIHWSVMDYNLPLQTIASKGAVLSLDKVQKQALRLICGAISTKPTAACDIFDMFVTSLRS